MLLLMIVISIGIKHITSANYSSFTASLSENMTLVIHPGIEGNTLKSFFEGLNNSGTSEDSKPVTIDLSEYYSDMNTSDFAYLFSKINVTCVILPDDMTGIHNQLFESANTLREIKIAASNENYVTEDGVLYKKVNGVKTEIIKYPPTKEGESFILPETVRAAAYGAFEQTVYLKTIPNFNIITNLKSMNIFYSSSVTGLVLNDSITIIPYYTFENSKIENITLPASLASIGINSFYNCSQLKTVTFKNTPPKKISAGNGHAEFDGCPNLECFYVPSGAVENYTKDTANFADLTKNAVGASLEKLILPESGTYTISSAQDLMRVSNWTNGTTPADFEGVKFIITTDITIEDPSWKPLSSTDGSIFKGALDGHWHTISVPMTLYKNKEWDYGALVGVNEGVIENIVYYLEWRNN